MFLLNRAARPTDCADASGPLWVERGQPIETPRMTAYGTNLPIRNVRFAVAIG